MKFIFAFLLMTLAPQIVFADAVIFSGNDVKALKQNLDLNGIAKVMSGTVDPSSVVTSANKGSIYLNTSTGITYQKQDAGSTTNWSKQAKNPMSTAGDVVYGGASGVETRLANGTAGQVLTSAGGAFAPTWTTAYTATPTKTSAYTTTTTDSFVPLDSTTAFTLTLHSAVTKPGQIITLYSEVSSYANLTTVITTSAQNIIGTAQGSSFVFSKSGQSVTLQSNGANWIVTGFNTNFDQRYSSYSTSTNWFSGALWKELNTITLPMGRYRYSAGLNMTTNSSTWTWADMHVSTTAGDNETGGIFGYNYMRIISAAYTTGTGKTLFITLPSIEVLNTTTTIYYQKVGVQVAPNIAIPTNASLMFDRTGF